jgi:hypothetical protein
MIYSQEVLMREEKYARNVCGKDASSKTDYEFGG